MDTIKNIDFWQFQKNTYEQVRVAIRSYKGKKYIDIRVYFIPDGSIERADDRYMPSKKGITIDAEFLPELKLLITKANDKLKQIEC